MFCIISSIDEIVKLTDTHEMHKCFKETVVVSATFQSYCTTEMDIMDGQYFARFDIITVTS